MGETRLDQLTAYLNENLDVSFLDLRDCLHKSKADDLLYELTDTHWTHKGAYIACKHVWAKIQESSPKEPLTRNTIVDETVERASLAY